jgi:hypothetical protein
MPKLKYNYKKPHYRKRKILIIEDDANNQDLPKKDIGAHTWGMLYLSKYGRCQSSSKIKNILLAILGLDKDFQQIYF